MSLPSTLLQISLPLPSFHPPLRPRSEAPLPVFLSYGAGGLTLGAALNLTADLILLPSRHHPLIPTFETPILGFLSHAAGGLTVGAALNLAPDLFAAAIMDVPFLDVLTTMSDPSLPLTRKERHEWGDPLASKVGGSGSFGSTP